MTRFGFFLFNILLLIFVYGLTYLNGAAPGAISYIIRNFTVPYVTLILLMCLITTIRWFMAHDSEVAHEIVTWVNALWVVPALTVLAIYFMGGLGHNFWQSLHTLTTLR